MSLLKLSKIFVNAISRWKEKGYEREDPFFNEKEYNKYLGNFTPSKADLTKGIFDEISKDEKEEIAIRHKETKEKTKNFISPGRALFKYLNDPNIFITYTNDPILSTNYSSYFGGKKKYNTPAGLYAYPIIELKDKTTNFAKNYKYVIATRFHGGLLISNKYTEEDLNRDLNILKEKFPEVSYNPKIKTPAGVLFSYIFELSKTNFSRFSRLFVELGYDGFYDVGQGIIHENEIRQAVFFTPKTSLEVLGIFDNFDNNEESLSRRLFFEELKNSSKEVQLKAIQKEPRLIQYLINPSEHLKQIAINEDPDVIKFIRDLSEELKLIAVERRGDVIQHIQDPSEQVQIAAIEQNPESIKHIKNPSEKIIRYAVKLCPWALGYVENPPEDLLYEAFKKNVGTIEYFKNPPKDIQLMAVQKDVFSIGLIKNPCEEAQIEAIKKAPQGVLSMLMKIIKNPTEKAKEEFLKRNESFIQT